MDLQERLADYLASLNTGLPVFNEYNTDSNSISIYALAGGRTIQEYMDGVKEKSLNYEIQVKVKTEDRDEGYNALGLISRSLEELTELNSSNGSFEFNKISISSEQYLTDVSKDNYMYFTFTFTAYVTVHNQ